ncbi:hypothetical protein Ciccas_007041, partial [Cichlidogyrus casuarinus]
SLDCVRLLCSNLECSLRLQLHVPVLPEEEVSADPVQLCDRAMRKICRELKRTGCFLIHCWSDQHSLLANQLLAPNAPSDYYQNCQSHLINELSLLLRHQKQMHLTGALNYSQFYNPIGI